MKRYILPAIGVIAVIAALVAIYAASVTGTPPATPPSAHAQGLAAPANQQARNNGNPGEAVVTWNAVPGAAGYRVGWMNNNDYEAARNLPNNQWLEQFTYADISRPNANRRTVTRLTPGDEYWFIVGTRNANGTVTWPNAWVPKFAVTPDARVCPTDQPGPPGATPAPTAVPTATPAPTPTPTPAATGGTCATASGSTLQALISAGICPAPTPTPTPQASQSSLLDFQNGRWLQQYHPAVYRIIAALPWIADGLTTVPESSAAEDLLYVAACGTPATAQALAGMSFLRQFSPGDASALSSLARIACRDYRTGTSHLRTVMAHPTVANGITDAWTPIIATLNSAAYENPSLISHLLNPNAGSLTERHINLPLAGSVRLAIVRVDEQSNNPEYMNLLEQSARQTESFMGVALPTDMVAAIFAPQLVEDGAGANYGGASIAIDEQYPSGRPVSINIIAEVTDHEVAHYYWRGDQLWIDEGMATTMQDIFKAGREQFPLAASFYPCAQHNSVAQLNANDGQPDACNYSLGERLFLSLYMRAGDTAFRGAVTRLYQAYNGSRNMPWTRAAMAFAQAGLEAAFRDGYSNGVTTTAPTPRPNLQLPELDSQITDVYVAQGSGESICRNGKLRDNNGTATISARQAQQENIFLCVHFGRQSIGTTPETTLQIVERYQDGFIYSARNSRFYYPNALWSGVIASRGVGNWSDQPWKPGRHTFYLQKDGQDRAAYTLVVTP